MQRLGFFRGLGHSDDVSPSPRADLEKRKNPVCHFVTPLDGSVEVDEHRRPEVLACERGWLGKARAPRRALSTAHGLGARVGFLGCGDRGEGALSCLLL